MMMIMQFSTFVWHVSVQAIALNAEPNIFKYVVKKQHQTKLKTCAGSRSIEQCGCKQLSTFDADLLPNMFVLSCFTSEKSCLCKERELNKLTGSRRQVQKVWPHFQQTVSAALFEKAANKRQSSVRQHGGTEIFTFLHNSVCQSVSQDFHIIRFRSIWKKTHRKVKTNTSLKGHCEAMKIKHDVLSQS